MARSSSFEQPGAFTKKHPAIPGWLSRAAVSLLETLMSKIIKAHSLTGRITDGLMLDSFKAVKRNRGAAGIDKVSIKMFEANLADNLRALMRDLKSGSFQPHPLRRHLIPKNETEFRPLGIPAVRDRVAQEVVRRLLNPIFEPLFHPSSYGFRHNRNCHMAVEAALKLHDEGFCDVVDADIQGFFDNLSHPIIMQSVAERVADGNILRLVEKFLTSGVMDNGVFKPTSVGTPQGGVVSPLLANIVLNHLDWQLDHAGYRFVRYADDFVVLCQTPRPGQRGTGFCAAGAGTAAQAPSESGENESDLLWKGLLVFRVCPLQPFPAHAAQVREEI